MGDVETFKKYVIFVKDRRLDRKPKWHICQLTTLNIIGKVVGTCNNTNIIIFIHRPSSMFWVGRERECVWIFGWKVMRGYLRVNCPPRFLLSLQYLSGWPIHTLYENYFFANNFTFPKMRLCQIDIWTFFCVNSKFLKLWSTNYLLNLTFLNISTT